MDYVSIRCLFMREGGASSHHHQGVKKNRKLLVIIGTFLVFVVAVFSGSSFSCMLLLARTTFRTDSPHLVKCTVVRFCSIVQASRNCILANCWDNTKHFCNRYKTTVDAYRRKSDCGTADGCNKSIHHHCTLENG
jgi:hypothetical protein